MKKIIAAALATLLIGGAVVPAMAQSYIPNCGFQDASLCEVKSLVDSD